MVFTLPRIALAGLTLLCTVQALAIESLTAADADPLHENALIERGLYVARLGDCIACHTAKGGAVLAGGLELKTPMGTIYSSNITPDRGTGIGQYSFDEFDLVMRQGMTPDGKSLYPVMPYPSYAKMSQDDMRALYAYLMRGVTAVRQANLEADMRFPFNQRWGLALWNLMFVDSQPFVPAPPTQRAVEPRGLSGTGAGALWFVSYPARGSFSGEGHERCRQQRQILSGRANR